MRGEAHDRKAGEGSLGAGRGAGCEGLSNGRVTGTEGGREHGRVREKGEREDGEEREGETEPQTINPGKSSRRPRVLPAPFCQLLRKLREM